MEQVVGIPRSATSTVEPLPQAKQEASRRKELADFFRTRRRALSPTALGLPETKRRKVRGLRREEVAEMAGISCDWYAWIEQSRPLNLSQSTLDRICAALRLNYREREHVFQLAGHPLPLSQIEDREQAVDSLIEVVRNMDPNPTYVLDTNWNLLAWNQEAQKLFGLPSEISANRPNFIRLMFTEQSFRALFVEWETVAYCMLAHFRSDSASLVGQNHWRQLVDEIQESSSEFRGWWPNHQVTWPMRWHKVMKHPETGITFYNTFDLELFRPDRLRIVTYIPSCISPNSHTVFQPHH